MNLDEAYGRLGRIRKSIDITAAIPPGTDAEMAASVRSLIQSNHDRPPKVADTVLSLVDLVQGSIPGASMGPPARVSVMIRSLVGAVRAYNHQGFHEAGFFAMKTLVDLCELYLDLLDDEGAIALPEA